LQELAQKKDENGTGFLQVDHMGHVGPNRNKGINGIKIIFRIIEGLY
jgi:hypothetical protein